MERDYKLQVRLNSYEREKLSKYAASVGLTKSEEALAFQARVSLTMSEAVRELIRKLSDT